MSYAITHDANGQFRVVAPDGQLMFLGGLTACQEWLDAAEFAQQSMPVPTPVPLTLASHLPTAARWFSLLRRRHGAA